MLLMRGKHSLARFVKIGFHRFPYQVSFKCDACSDEDAAGKTNVGETFTDRVEFACVDTEDHQDAEDDVGNYEEEISNAEKAKQMVENTSHRSLAQYHQTKQVSNYEIIRINIIFYWLKTYKRQSQNS